jgi:cardiolipin-specific phospholipase
MSQYVEVKGTEFTNFFLAGHSFGGYVSGNYALAYPHHVRKLILLSPIGIKVKDPNEPDLDPMKRFEGRKGPPRWVLSFVKRRWDRRESPFTYARKVYKKLSWKFISRYVQKRQKTENRGQMEAVTDYMYQIFLSKGTTEHALAINFDVSL